MMVTAVPCVGSRPLCTAALQQHQGLFTTRRGCRRVIFNREMERRPPNTPLVVRKQYNPPSRSCRHNRALPNVALVAAAASGKRLLIRSSQEGARAQQGEKGKETPAGTLGFGPGFWQK